VILSWTRVLGGLCAVLALTLGLEWVLPGGSPQETAGHAVHLFSAGTHTALPVRETSGWAETILARPLFSISRRPPRVVAGKSSETPVGQARLTGIMISRTRRTAIFAPDGGGKPLVLAEGGSVNDSTIRSIQPDRVVMASGAVLRPSYDRNRVNGLSTTPPFQPVMPNFANPGFAKPGFPPNNFGNPGLPPQGFNPVQPQAADENGGPPNPPQPLPPALQNPSLRLMLPQRRE
jgi:hypothetical protein